MRYSAIGEEFAARAVTGEIPKKEHHHSARLFLERRTAYSYGRHFPIAVILMRGVVAFTTAKYSTSTSRQTGEVRRALEKAGVTMLEADLYTANQNEELDKVLGRLTREAKRRKIQV